MVRVVKEQKNGRKKKHLSQKDFVKTVLKSMSLELSNAYKGLGHYDDELIITVLANNKSKLDNILSNLIYTD